MQEKKILELRNLHCSFGSIKALDGVDFDLYAGEIHGLVGDHRAGKSSLAKVLGGWNRVQEGTIIFDQKKFGFFSPRTSLERRINVVYQELSIIPHLDAVENLFTGRMLTTPLHRLDRKKMVLAAERAFEYLDCPINLTVPAMRLSLMQQHMVEFARAIVVPPKVLVLDEISNKLRPDEMKTIYRVLFDLREKQCGIIYISHDMGEILKLASRITVLKNGHRQLTMETGSLDTVRLYEMTYSFNVGTTRKGMTEEPLRGVVRELQKFIQVLPVGIFVLDNSGRIQLFNVAAHELISHGPQPLVDSDFLQLLNSLASESTFVTLLENQINQRQAFHLDDHRLNSGRVVRIHGIPLHSSDNQFLGTLLALEDVTNGTLVNDLLINQAKMTSVAELAVGVAHEMNNPLFVIQNYLEVIRLQDNLGTTTNYIDEIDKEIGRIVDVVSSLLAFSRTGPVPNGRIELSETLDTVIILLQHLFREKNVKIERDFPGHPVWVHGNENRLVQVFLNLVTNAVDAVLYGGCVRLILTADSSGNVETIVEDNGCGIADGIKALVFQPFFTTKLTKTNTGLGLPICRHIVEELGGSLDFSSHPGIGTKFFVRFPCLG